MPTKANIVDMQIIVVTSIIMIDMIHNMNIMISMEMLIGGMNAGMTNILHHVHSKKLKSKRLKEV